MVIKLCLELKVYSVICPSLHCFTQEMNSTFDKCVKRNWSPESLVA